MCAICGETSHLTRDCPQRHDRKKMEESRQRDHAYLQFMEELEGKAVASPPRSHPPESDVSNEALPALPAMPAMPAISMGSAMPAISMGSAMPTSTTISMGSALPVMATQPITPIIQPMQPMPMMRPGVIGYSQESLQQSLQQQNPMQNLRRKERW